jgi:hypothetical protein
MDVAVLGEGQMEPYAVDRYAQDPRIVLVELRHDLLIEHHLIAADRAPTGRIERENDGAAGKVGK